MYYYPCRDYYSPNMAAEVYNKVRSCTACQRIGKYRDQREIELFSPIGPSELVPFDIFGSPSRTKSGDQFVVIITNTYSKLNRALPTTKITPIHVANNFQYLGYSVWHPRYRPIEQRTAVREQTFQVHSCIPKNEKTHNHCVS